MKWVSLIWTHQLIQICPNKLSSAEINFMLVLGHPNASILDGPIFAFTTSPDASKWLSWDFEVIRVNPFSPHS